MGKLLEALNDKKAAPILIVWEHGGRLGHLARVVPVAKALQSGGRQVVFATPHTEAVVPYLQGTGVTVVAAPQIALPRRLAADLAHMAILCPADVLLRCGFVHPPSALACIQQWQKLLNRLVPSAVLIDASPMALYAANLVDVPVVALGHGFELPPTIPGLDFEPWMQGDSADLNARIAHREQLLLEAMSGLRQGLAAASQSAANGSVASEQSAIGGSLSIQAALCTWPELDHFDRSVTAGGPSTQPLAWLPRAEGGYRATRYVGPIWHDIGLGQAGSAAQWPDKPGAKVLCYLQIVDSRYDYLWQALLAHEANVLVLSPDGNAKACESARGWGITVQDRVVELAQLLPQCDACVNHGGMGLSSALLHAGKPLLFIPTQVEQALLGYQLHRRGLALSTIDIRNKENMDDLVSRLLTDPAVVQRAQAFARKYEGFTPQHAVNTLVSLLTATARSKQPASATSSDISAESTPC